MNNMDMNKIMEMLSKMDKKDLEKGLAEASKVFGNSNSKDEILKKLNNMNK